MSLFTYEVTSSPNHLLHQRIRKGSLQLLCPPFFESSASFELSILLELFLAKYMFFQYFFFSKQLIPVCSIFLHCVFGLVAGLVSLDLDLRSFINYCQTRASLVGSPASSVSADGRRDLSQHPRSDAWPARAREFVSLFSAWWPHFSFHPFPGLVLGGLRWFLVIFFVVLLSAMFFLLLFFFLCYLGFCFSLWESTVFEFVLVTLFTVVLFLDFNSVVTILTIFW